MRVVARADYRMPLLIGALICGLLFVLLYACSDDGADPRDSNGAPESPADTAARDNAVVVESTGAGSGDGPVHPAEKIADESLNDKSHAQSGDKPARKVFGKPGTQSRTVVVGEARGKSKVDGRSGAGPEGQPDTSTGGSLLSGTPGAAQAGGESVAGRDGKTGGQESDRRGETQDGIIRSAANPNSALAGITPVPGYVRISESPAVAPSGGSSVAGEADAFGIVPGSSGDSGLPVPALKLVIGGIKTFRFTWADAGAETEYRLQEKISGASGYRKVATLPADTVNYDHKVFLPRRADARYILQACNDAGCASSTAVRMTGSLAEAVGYIKASNTGSEDRFGHSVAISGDGGTLAVGAPAEDSAAAGINSEQSDNSAPTSGAVYIFVRDGDGWIQQAYVKAASPRKGEEFGYALALSDDGNTLAVGAGRENSNLNRIKGDVDTTRPSGGVYIFTRRRGAWGQQLHMKAPSLADKDTADTFGAAVALSSDGNTLAVGADGESGNATGINGEQNTGRAKSSGAVYVFMRRGGSWSQQAYVKASNTGAGDHFGRSVSLSSDGNTLAVGAVGEDSAATGVNGNQHDETAVSSGAVYVFTRRGGDWSQQAYLKASNNRPGDLLTADEFGGSVALSGNGDTLAVGARFEDSTVTGVNANQHASSKYSSGAVYVFARRGGDWAQQSYVKASNTGWGDEFGGSVALSASGNTLAVGAIGEDSHAVGINGDEDNNMLKSPGAVYVFTRGGGNWIQRAYVKASNTMLVPRDPEHAFGFAVVLSATGDTLAVGAPQEDSAVTGVGSPNDTFAGASGAVYLY